MKDAIKRSTFNRVSTSFHANLRKITDKLKPAENELSKSDSFTLSKRAFLTADHCLRARLL
ncbi:hypothetical protein AGR13a_Lc30057 [Agrobacterium genomosp. 13 str. CFBP 6927]|uniref:Uncharacterized protein n=1 Tax=Agrobacterium genomosp. 13 str. CFBP 6927 TaxID=1183428 RepID=A0ABM9VL52_9HYPH|nr:hypothetical protein AGR13a_Lc30057 [Agrobacterium genomosp. 13 str. CFBP 6927]